jgi:hypothetical protein
MPGDSSTEVNEVIVVATADPNTAANLAEAASTDSGSLTEEIIDAILDPLGANEGTSDASAAPAVIEEVMLVEPGVESTIPDDQDIGAGFSEAGAAPVGTEEPVGVTDPSSGSSEFGDPETAAELYEAGDAPSTETASGDTSDASATTTDSTDTQTQADSDAQSDAQYNLQQAEHAEGEAAASGDYATAQDQAQNAYWAAEDLANAGGPDHTDETWDAMQSESWANWDQQSANENAQSAESYAESGDLDGAEVYADAAQDQQESADSYGAEGEYGGDLGPAEDTATVDESTAVDTSSVDETSASSE